MTQVDKPQLKMVWPTSKIDQPPRVTVPDGFEIRQGKVDSQSDDLVAFDSLMSACGWQFDAERMQYCFSRLLPSGWFVVIDSQTQRLVASAMSLHNYTGRSVGSGTLGWVACLSEYRGNRLGGVVSSAATTRLLEAGYHDVELYTECFRQPAIKTYFQLGFVPYIYNDAVKEVWREVCRQTRREFVPEQWPHGDNAYPST